MFLKIIFRDLAAKNNEFLQLVVKAIQFNNYTWSCLPSLVFLIFSMFIIHKFTHKNLGNNLRINIYRDALYREIAFQWIYLYLTKIWFFVVKAFRTTTDYLISSIRKAGGLESSEFYIEAIMFSLFCLTCSIPLIVIASHFNEVEQEENFLLWIPRNRWTRSELGSAGRLMERPPSVTFTASTQQPAYQAKRSVSSQVMTYIPQANALRYSRSGYTLRPVSSINEMVSTN